jgi:hypothetical protein
MTGRLAEPTLTVRAGDWFGPWQVTRAGLRLWKTASNPYGNHAADCQCRCGATRTWRVTQLPALAKDGPDCQHKSPGRKARRSQARPAAGTARPATPPRTRRAAPARPAWRPGQQAQPRPAPLPRQPAPRPPRARRPVPERIPAGQLRAGMKIGGWKILRDDLEQDGARWLLLSCLTCPRQRRTRRQVVAEGRCRPCRHQPAAQAASTPGQDRAYQWMAEHAPDRAVTAREVGNGLGLHRTSATYLLARLTRAGRVTQPWRALYTLAGVTASRPGQAGRDAITAYLAADGGGTFGEILQATGIDSGRLSNVLDSMTRAGELTRTEDRASRFYLLPGQQPGEQVGPPGNTAPAS